MTGPEFGDGAGGWSTEELDDFAIPDTGGELVALIDERKELQERVYTWEYLQKINQLQDILRKTEAQFGDPDNPGCMYFSQQSGDARSSVLIVSTTHPEQKEAWHIFTCTEETEDDLIALEYEEFALAKDCALFSYFSSFCTKSANGAWNEKVLRDCAMLKKTQDAFVIRRGRESELLMPSIQHMPQDSGSYDEFLAEALRLAEILTQLSPGMHDENVTRGLLH